MPERLYTLKLTDRELWVLNENYQAAFTDPSKRDAEEVSVSQKLVELSMAAQRARASQERMTVSRIRALWRRLFRPEPPIRLDGIIICMRMALDKTLTFEQALVERDAENRARVEAWKRGEVYFNGWGI